MGFMQSQSLDISEIMTETSTEPSSISLEEDDDTEESRTECEIEDPFELNEKKFITSPADIDIHRKVICKMQKLQKNIRKFSKSYVMNTKISFL